MILECHESGTRLDVFLANQLADMTRSAAQHLAEAGLVLVNGKPGKKNLKLSAGDILTVTIPEPEPIDILPENIPLDVVYEDDDVIVVNKPRGMVVHPAPGHYSGTLVNALMYHCGDSLSGINGALRPGIVHRIDMDTSGLIIAAKNDLAHTGLAEQLKDHSLSRVYEAVAVGNIRSDSGTIDAPIGRHPADRKKMAVTEKNSRSAVTHYRVLGRYPGYTHLELRLETGRTHQIRVHLAWQNHPILGDEVYGRGKELGLTGQCLHARRLRFIHPRSGEEIQVECPLPDYFETILNKLEKMGKQD